MKLGDYIIDVEHAVHQIITNKYQTIALQIPEGLKQYAFDIIDVIEDKTAAHVVVSADPCFGACDLVNYELKNLDVDFVIHIGHTAIPDVEHFWIPTLFLNAEATRDIKKTIEASLSYLEGTQIGLVTTTQHLHVLNDAQQLLKQHGFTPVIGHGDDRIQTNGQILGCNFSTATAIKNTVDSYLFIGSGTFHPLGLLMTTKKPVIAADPYTNEVKKEELTELKDQILRQRYGAIARSKDAKHFGILVGVKRGQQRKDLAYNLREMLQSKKKQAYIITLEHFSPLNLQGFQKIDCYVSTACPRIAIDDYMQYKVPLITPVELEIVLGKRLWDEYTLDQIMT